VLEPPQLADRTIVGALRAGFGIGVAELTFLPVGNDSASWAYRVEAVAGPSYFLKVRAGTGGMPGAAVPAHLHRHGVGREAFRPARRELLADLEELLTAPAPDDPVAAELAAFWRARQDVIR
jgi:hypothetical protein